MKTELRFALTVLLFYALVGAGILLAGVVVTDALFGTVLP